MNSDAQHIIAKDGEKVVGYALAMTKRFRDKITVLKSMFDLLDGLVVNGLPLGDEKYIVMGQICVDYDYRGKGIFQGMYHKYFEVYKPVYQSIITEIAARNTRSLRAHLNIGFKEIHRYVEPGVEEWIVVKY
jgi:GNAT superfamily N-acetyltransferase